MAIENNIAASQPKVFQPLPRQDTRRPIADFTSKARPARQDTLALPPTEPPRTREAVETARPTPPAPMFPRTVEREAPIPAAARAAAGAPKPRTAEAAVPVRLNTLLQEARGREVVARIKQTGGLQTAIPAPKVAPAQGSVERAPIAPARVMEPAAAPAPARPRFAAMNSVAQEITQLSARQAMQTQVRDRGVAENASAGRTRSNRTLIDQRV
jgi:hypothetical protein